MPQNITPAESDAILPSLRSPGDLKGLTAAQLKRLAAEIREELCRVADHRAVHFASNLGVVELTIALHSSFDFLHDRLIWDTGHQAYPHKLLTGRYARFASIRTKGGLMGFPNPEESPYDLMMTGHAGCSVGTAIGLTCGDDLIEGIGKRHSFAVIGDGALGSGVVFESMNHAGGLRKNLTVILNDNKMSICPRVGGLSKHLDQIRMAPTYLGFKHELQRFVHSLPLMRDTAHRFFAHFKQAVKAGLLGGMLFEEFGFRYIGPVDGHDIPHLQKLLKQIRKYEEPVLLHVFTEKGHGFTAAENDPTTYHAPSPTVKRNGNGNGNSATKNNSPQIAGSDVAVAQIDGTDGDCEPNEPMSFTHWMAAAIYRQLAENPKACVITAAMCQGNMLESVRDAFPDRFFDVGICESHAVIFAAGLAKAGMRPIVDIYSTFMQRSYDQIFQEVSLQNLPIVLVMDRAGLCGPDGPTHHGVFDVAFLRPFPNLTVMAPGDARDVQAMLDFAICQNGPCAIRYPKCTVSEIVRNNLPILTGKAETLKDGSRGHIVVFGGLLAVALEAAGTGPEIGVINARFAKPLDVETILSPLREGKFLITLEESALSGGFGSAVLEAANEFGIDARRLTRLGIPDKYVAHGDRNELLADLELDAASIRKKIESLLEATDQ